MLAAVGTAITSAVTAARRIRLRAEDSYVDVMAASSVGAAPRSARAVDDPTLVAAGSDGVGKNPGRSQVRLAPSEPAIRARGAGLRDPAGAVGGASRLTVVADLQPPRTPLRQPVEAVGQHRPSQSSPLVALLDAHRLDEPDGGHRIEREQR